MGGLQKGVNDLESWCSNNGSFGKQLMNEWTGECEDGTQYNIDEVTRGSHKWFKWRCSECHEWLSTVNTRTNAKSGCPYCYNTNRGRIVSKAKLSNENSLKTWCLSNGSFGKQLISEWTGICEDGTHSNIDQVSFGSGKKFNWRCSKGHEWYATVHSRTSQKHGCPYCYNTNRSEKAAKARLSNENSLQTWCLNNGSFGEQLIQEWTGKCNDGKHYKIDEVSFGSSHKKFKWICSAGHEWYTKIVNRTLHKTGCPYCQGHRVSDTNSLKTWCSSNDSFGKKLISEWTGLCEDDTHYNIDQVSFGIIALPKNTAYS